VPKFSGNAIIPLLLIERNSRLPNEQKESGIFSSKGLLSSIIYFSLERESPNESGSVCRPALDNIREFRFERLSNLPKRVFNLLLLKLSTLKFLKLERQSVKKDKLLFEISINSRVSMEPIELGNKSI
jgi:hypothetical protein